MPDLIDLDELCPAEGLGKAPGDFTRDRRTTPFVSNENGDTVKSGPRAGEVKWERYGRPSSLGKAIENTKALERWNERQVALGFVADISNTGETTPLSDAIAAYLQAEQSGGDERTLKGLADGIVVAAKRANGAHLAAERGTHAHTLTEEDEDKSSDAERRRLNRLLVHGEMSLDMPADAQIGLMDAWRELLDHYGLEILHTEQPVVHDGWRVAGTTDHVARLTRDITFDNGVTLEAGSVVCLDKKTGQLRLTANGRIQYWHSYSVQVAVYAMGRPYDTENERRFDWDEPMRQDYALIAHVSVADALAGKATARLVLVDIATAAKAIDELIVPQKAWAKHNPFGLDDHVIEVGCGEAPAEEAAPADDLYRMWLTARLAQVRADDKAKALMMALWPAGVPGLKSGHAHSADELAAIEAVVTRIEAERQLPFVPDPRPLPEPAEVAQITPWQAPDEGELLGMEHEDVVGLRKRIERLEPAEQSIAEQWMTEAVRAGRGFSLKQKPSRRRWLIYRLVLDMAIHLAGEPNAVRATLALAIPEAEQLGVTIGCAIGSLTIEEARMLLERIPDLAQTGALIFDGEVPRWSAATAA